MHVADGVAAGLAGGEADRRRGRAAPRGSARAATKWNWTFWRVVMWPQPREYVVGDVAEHLELLGRRPSRTGPSPAPSGCGRPGAGRRCRCSGGRPGRRPRRARRRGSAASWTLELLDVGSQARDRSHAAARLRLGFVDRGQTVEENLTYPVRNSPTLGKSRVSGSRFLDEGLLGAPFRVEVGADAGRSDRRSGWRGPAGRRASARAPAPRTAPARSSPPPGSGRGSPARRRRSPDGGRRTGSRTCRW